MNDPPASLEGLATHSGGTDLGLTGGCAFGGQAYASLYQNINNPHGQELGVGAFTDWVSGAWTLRPAAGSRGAAVASTTTTSACRPRRPPPSAPHTNPAPGSMHQPPCT